MIPANEDNERTRRDGNVIIQEELHDRTNLALRFAARTLNIVDPRREITHVVPMASVLRADYYAWRTRAEHAANPNSYAMGR